MNPAIENHPIRDAIERSETISAFRTNAQEADQKAREQELTRETANAEVKKIQSLWVNLLEGFELLKGELAGAREALQYGQEQSQNRHSAYLNWQTGVNTQFLQGAREVASIIAGVKILKERVTFKEKLLAEHVDKMRAFGKEHGIDEETLNGLT